MGVFFDINDFILHLKKNRIKGASQHAIGKAIGVNQGYVSHLAKGIRPFKDEYLIRLKETYGEEVINSFLEQEDTPQVSNESGVPYFDVDFIGGFDVILNDQTINPTYFVDFKKYNSADCWCNVTGKSMEPEISHGDIIALKEIVDWRTFIPFGEIYAIVTDELRTIKRVGGSEKDDFFTLHPINTSPEFQKQEIPKKIIIKMYKVLGCMKKI